MSELIGLTHLSANNPIRVELPQGATILSAGYCKLYKQLAVWWRGDDSAQKIPRIFYYRAHGELVDTYERTVNLIGHADSPDVGRVHIFEVVPWARCGACGIPRNPLRGVCHKCGEGGKAPWWAWERRQAE